MASLRQVAAVAAVLAAVATACSTTSGSPPGPSDCAAIYSQVRCSNMADYAALKLRTAWSEIVAIGVLPRPTPEVRDGVTILHVTSGGPNVMTLVTLRDGSVHEVSMDCGGIPPIHCRDNPELQAASVTMGGYFDTPEGATPVPSPDRVALAAAKPMRVPSLDIPVDHDGHYEVPVGEATLPNGVLSVADFTFASTAWPTSFTIADGVVKLDVRSLDNPGRLFANIHDHGLVAGTERVEGVLVFDVLHHSPGAVLSVRDLRVQ